ncbi:hypothetical protein DUNSADRAFT_2058 [Dunaliella salina]|uniref:peptidylprolyl isomerase n=1 Tax=Dunaliella salina TaxID=3046 RepID=A0ABQ7FWP1_DUNSA|nr:hypothetical protein DUNSADRAFT_2058 [Dunaliella salina]|eukprot:KAF5826791.1 hypothetical protein DUNSADRAFT_2058 [Dunaliella salina]
MMEGRRGVEAAHEHDAGKSRVNAEAEDDGQEAGPPRPPPEDEEEPDVGPVMPPSKKRKALEFEDQYLKQLPTAQMYERSYMHRDTVTHVMVTPSGFIITASVDGCLKFWKKQQEGIEFVKLYRAHLGAVDDLACSCDGHLLASLSRDKTVKVYDVLNFDMIAMIRTPFVPGCVEWIFKRGEAQARLAISDFNSGDIYVYDARSGSSEPIHIHKVDKSGLKFVTVSRDRRIRVFKFKTGKLMRAYDESLEAAHELQRSGHEAFVLEDIDFGRRLAVEKELATAETAPPPNAVFDESGNFLLYPSLLGIKVVNLVTNHPMFCAGKVENTERFLRVALFQGTANKKAKMKIPTVELLDKIPQPDPTLVCCAFRRQRLFLFSKREPKDVEEAEGAEAAAAAVGGRDVFNEKPSLEDILTAEGEAGDALVLPRGITIHTNKGDITAKLFPDECPKTVENFTTHAKNGYYDNVIFHRVIKGFMIQTGDPLGDGTGGESIWGGEFQDEFHKMLRHDRPGILSMANAGPNTNGSQFFITGGGCSWLDNKHTVFGRVVKGMDVVHMIEKAKVNKEDRPYEDIKIVNMTAHDTVDV